MCGRYQAWVEDDELMRIIEREKRGNTMRFFRQNEVFPGSIIPVLYGSYSTVRAHLSTWGYDVTLSENSSSIEDYSSSDHSERKCSTSFLINARSESAHSKPLFRDSLMQNDIHDRRVAIITSGYFEWDSHEGTDRKKVRYLIRPSSPSDALLLCGLETTYGKGEYHHVILTTSAYGSPSRIHHRMPLFLRRDELNSWLYDTDFALKKLRERVPCDLEVIRA